MPVAARDDIADTMASVRYWLGPSRFIVLVDDTGSGLPGLDGPDTAIIPAPAASGSHWWKIATGYRYLCDRYEPEVVLRLDADALVTGPTPEEDAIRAFAADPTVGMLGSYRFTCDGEPRDFDVAAPRIRQETGARSLLRNWRRTRALRRLLHLAENNGYEMGEHVLGAGYFHSASCVRALYENGWLDMPELASSLMRDDHIFSLMTVSAGYRIEDFATGDKPLGLKWKGLPDSPARLIERGKKIVHSVRSWEDMDEAEIRAVFRAQRTGAAVADRAD